MIRYNHIPFQENEKTIKIKEERGQKYNEEDIQRFMANIMKEDDTFNFDCKKYVNCCRNRKEPIMLAGYDIFRMSKALSLEPVRVISKYTEWYVGSNSNLQQLY